MTTHDVTVRVLRIVAEQAQTIINSNLPVEDELALWTLVHDAADAACEPWQSAQTTEEVLSIFADKFQEAYRKLTASS